MDKKYDKIDCYVYGSMYLVVILLVAGVLRLLAPDLRDDWLFMVGMAIGIPLFLLVGTHPLVSQLQAWLHRRIDRLIGWK